MNVQRLILSQKQLAEVFPTQSNLYLLSDETSKFGGKKLKDIMWQQKKEKHLF